MKNTWVWIVVAVVVVGGGYLLLSSSKTEEVAQTPNQEVEQTPEGKKMAFSEFLKQNDGAYKCEVHQAMSDMENTGTVYISSGKVKGEFSTIAEGRTMEISFLSTDGFTYTWNSMMPNMGFKTKIKAQTAGDTSASTSGTYSWNAEQIGDYNCVTWTVDQSKFVVPTNIKFQEMSS